MSIGDLLSSYGHLIGLAGFGGLALLTGTKPCLGLRDLPPVFLQRAAVALLAFFVPIPPVEVVRRHHAQHLQRQVRHRRRKQRLAVEAYAEFIGPLPLRRLAALVVLKRAEASRATRACGMRMRVRRGEYLVCGKRAICVIAATNRVLLLNAHGARYCPCV